MPSEDMDDLDYNEETTPRDQFVEDILKMLERGSLNDVKIKLSDGEIFANKDILMARSEYFATMFSNYKSIEGETSSVEMSHCSKALMEKIVKYLFSGGFNFDGLSLTQLLELSHLAEIMLLPDYAFAAEDFIIGYQLPTRVECPDEFQALAELISGLKLADQYKRPAVKNYIIKEHTFHVKRMLEDVKGSDSFKTLPFNLIKDICSHTKGFEAFVFWLSANEITEEEKADIIENVNFEGFTVEELLTFVKDSGFYSAKEIDERVLELYKESEEKYKELEKRYNNRSTMFRNYNDWD